MGKGVKVSAPKIKIGKDLGLKNIGKGVSALAKNAGKVGSKLVSTAGKGIEGIGKNTFDIAGAVAKGDFKGIGKEGLELLQSGKDIAKGLGSAAVTANTGLLGAAGTAAGATDITRAAQNIDREGQKGINKYGDAAIDIGANIASGGTYGLAKQAAQGLSSGGLGGLVSGKGLQDMALGVAGSYAGVDPNLLKMGMSAAQGDLKGAALQGLANYGGFDPNMLKMGVSALTGDKGGLASGLASQFGAGDSASNFIGALAGGNKSNIASAVGAQLGLDPKMSSLLGSVASGDIKGAALREIASATGLDPKLMSSLSSGKIKPEQIAGAMGLDTKKILGGAADKLGISSFTSSPEAKEMENLGRSAGRDIASVEKNIEDSMSNAKNLTEKERKALEAAKQRELQDEMGKIDFTKPPKKTKILGQNADEQSARLEAQGDKALPPPTNPWTFDRILGNIKREAGQAVDKIKSGTGSAGNMLSSAGNAVAGFAANNPNLIEGAIQGAGAYAGYKVTSDSAKKQQEILKRQEDEASQIREMEKFQFDPRRSQAYDQSYGFQQDIIGGGGYTGVERAQQKADDLRAAKMRQAAKMAGERTLAEKGQGSTGSGQAYASMLAGQQEAADVGTQLDLAREKQAAENLRGAYKELPEMMENKSKAEMNLAQQRSTEDVNRATQLEAVRQQQTAAEQARAQAMATLAGKATDTVSGLVADGLESYKKDAQKKKDEAAKAEAAKQNIPVSKTPTTSTKAGAAAQVAGNRPPAEMATGQPGSGAGVLAPQYLPNAGNFNQQLSKPKSGVEQLLSGDLLKQGQQLMSKAPAPVQQTVNKAVDKGKEEVNKFASQFGLKF